jgi:hypothetical protein
MTRRSTWPRVRSSSIPSWSLCALIVAACDQAPETDGGCERSREASIALQEASACVTLGAKQIADMPFVGTPSLEQATADCQQYYAMLQASGWNREDAEIYMTDIPRVTYMCPNRTMRAAVLIEGEWLRLPGLTPF